MGTGGDLWDTLDLISAARMNQKTVYIKDTAPSVTYPGQLWFDTSVNKLKIRNAANTGWIDTFPPASHTHVASDVTSGTFDLARIPNMDWAHISGVFPRSISDVISSAFSRSWISDFFSTPFWDNIPDKPSTFPPSSHVHDASEITSGVLDEARVPHTFSSPIWFNADINCRHIALQSNYSIYPYSADNSTYLWLLSYYSEEYYPRFQIDISGKMGWGSGSASPDVNLYRYAADVLKTDDTLDVYALRISGTTVIDSSRRLVGLASVYQSLTPTSSSAYNLGSSTYRWNYLYVNYAYLYSGLYMGGTQVMDASRNLLNIAGISCTDISLAGSLDMYNGPRYLYMRSNLSSDGDIGYIHFKNDYTNKIMEILSTIRSGKYYIEYYYYDGSNWYFLGSIDQDKNWRFEGEAILNFNRTRITGFDGSYFHWIRSSSDDSKLWMAFVASDAQGSPSRIHMNQNITVAGGKVFRFLGNSSGTLSDLGYIEFYDSYFSGGRNLQMKGIYETDGKYYLQWYYWDGANWLSLMRLSQDGTLIGKDIRPFSTSTYDLGSPSSMWRFLYSYIPINYYSGPSTTILRRDDTAVYGYETTMTKKKEIYLSFIVPTTCTLNIYFELFANYDPEWGQDTAYGRIYRNGSPYGTLRTVSTSTWTGFEETLSFSAGDYVQIYCCCALGVGYGVRYFRIRGTLVNQLVEGLGRIRSLTGEYPGFEFGDGTTYDVNLYRSGANILKTDDAFQAASYAVGTTTVISSSRYLMNIAYVSSDLLASSTSYSLGSSTYKWGNLHANYGYFYSGLYMSGTQILDSSRILYNIASASTSLTPTIDATYNLGASSYRWNYFYAVNKSASFHHPLHNPSVDIVFTCTESPKVTIEDWGTAELSNGEAFVTFSEEFAALISDQKEYTVFLQPEGESNQLFVAKKEPHGFRVKEKNGGRSNIKFSWHVKAYRVGDEDKPILEPHIEDRQELAAYEAKRLEEFRVKEYQRLERIKANILRYRTLVGTNNVYKQEKETAGGEENVNSGDTKR